MINAKPLRVGIAGYGVVGKRRHDCLKRHGGMSLVAVCDRTFTADGMWDDGVRYYGDYGSLLA
jgi:glyceraldehyde-3-phosphate dehydrogenase/erythrose-4-phosphate dehydrogenase